MLNPTVASILSWAYFGSQGLLSPQGLLVSENNRASFFLGGFIFGSGDLILIRIYGNAHVISCL